jgi:hypothetical protein
MHLVKLCLQCETLRDKPRIRDLKHNQKVELAQVAFLNETN